MNKPKFLWAVCAFVFLAFGASPAQAQEWKPTRPVEFSVAAGPGGSLDQKARMLKQILEGQGLLPTPLVIVNRPQGAGLAALNALDSHPKDAHYLTSWAHQWLTNYITGEWQVQTSEFTLLAILFNEYVGLAVRADSPLKTGADLVARLKADPNSVSIGVATALGNHIHIGAAKPLKAAGVNVSKLLVVPYKSSAESVTAVMGGHLDVAAGTTPNLLALKQAGRIRVLAVTAPDRLGGAFADVPTWREQGVNAQFASAQGIMAPKGTPQAQVDFWVAALKKATDSPEWQAFVQRNQWTPRFLAGAQAQAFVEGEIVEMRAILRELGLAKQ